MKNIHVLATDKPSRLWMTKLGNLTRCHDIKPIKEALGNNVNIYITNSEEIEKDEWCIDNSNEVFKFQKFMNYNHYKKIILTTDQDLIKDGVQAIPDEFLEWFVQNPSCESIELEKWTDYKFENDKEVVFFYYKIIIPKEEPKQELGGIPKGKVDMVVGKPKQETLEEFIKSIYPPPSGAKIKGIELGAKWQQERNEEDLRTAWNSSAQNMRFTFSSSAYRNISFEQWLEQFKKE